MKCAYCLARDLTLLDAIGANAVTNPTRTWLTCATIIVLGPIITNAAEREILDNLRLFMNSPSAEERAAAIDRIQHDPAYDRSRVSTWLHASKLFDTQDSGVHPISVKIGQKQTLRTLVRIPAGYDASRPYPLIYGLHGMGGRAENIIAYVEALLGEQVEQFVIAAPSGYQQVLVRSTTPPSAEHVRVLRAVRQFAHIDCDRVYALGYSQGGHAAWTLSVTHPDQFAGIVPIAGTLLLPESDQLLPTFLPNLANTHVFACWGEDDSLSNDGKTPSPGGGIAGLNRQICKLAAENRWPITWYECAGAGHGGIVPPKEDIQRVLKLRRAHYPQHVQQTFRLVHQGQTYWLETQQWSGSWWDEQPLKLSFRAEENPNLLSDVAKARGRAVRSLLGELRGDVEGQKIDVYRKKVRELTVWIGDDMIDWSQPIEVEISGRTVYEGQITPDLGVCLRQAARTYDFDRLRWAGIHYKTGSRAKLITAETEFTDPPTVPK